MSYEIQKLEPQNYHKCNNISNMNKNEHFIVRSKKRYDELVAGNRVTFVYVENGAYLGEGSLVLNNGDPDYTVADKRIYVSRMVVKPEHRNCGIGGIILDFLIDYAKNLGYEEMSLGVNIVNIGARWLYEKKGFTTTIYVGEDENGKYVKLLKAL
jgi:Acetyltransferases